MAHIPKEETDEARYDALLKALARAADELETGGEDERAAELRMIVARHRPLNWMPSPRPMIIE